jgi:predicted nucleotidyltransferase
LGYKGLELIHAKKQAIELLQQHKPELQKRFGVVCLAILGPTARDIAISKLGILFYAHKKDNINHFYAHKSEKYQLLGIYYDPN